MHGARWTRFGQGLLGIAGLVLILEAVPRSGLVSDRYLPPFSAMMRALGPELTGSSFWSALGATVTAWGIGLAIAMGLGTLVGLAIGSVPLLRAVTASTIEFLRPVPSVALIPLIVLVYGTRADGTIVLVVYAAFWQVLIQVLYGVQDVDPVLRETARSYRFGYVSQIRHVVWPTTLPFLMTGFRLAATVALVLTITAQLVIGSPGLGRQIAVAQSSGAVSTLYALVIVTGLLGVVVNMAARALERRTLAWHPSMRAESSA